VPDDIFLQPETAIVTPKLRWFEVVLGNASLTATLQYADNSGMSTNLVTVCSGRNSIAGVLSLTNINTVMLSGVIPAGKYRRIVTAVTGTGTPTAQPGQQIELP